MTYYVDIDNTICYTNHTDYVNSKPILSRIHSINSLYHQGHRIVYWTARGSASKKDWSQLTIQQLDEWGCKRHDVVFGKPSYDLYIDDKSINSSTFFNDNI
jgi:hypothetical protein